MMHCGPDWNSQWDALDPAQGDGRACVICGDFFADSGVKRHSVGQSPKDYEVFACESDDRGCLAAVQRRHDAWEGLQNADQFEQLMTTMAARPGQPREVGEDLAEKR